MISTTIPIQGTFDIAKGRSSLRTHITAQRWEPTFGARASAALTALGELILSARTDRLVAVRLNIVAEGENEGVEFNCQLHSLDAANNRQWLESQQRLGRATDNLHIQEVGGGIQINAQVRLH